MPVQFKLLEPKSVLAVAAHPDDLEFGFAGSAAKWVQAGASVYYLILTNGNKGSDDRSLTPKKLRDLRRAEQRAAARILGVKEVFFRDYEDGLLEPTAEVKCDVVRIIRKVKPEVVYCMDPTMVYSPGFGINHSDHRAAGMATIDAVYPLARDHLSFPKLCNNEKLEPHKVKTLLMANFDKQNFYVDISEVIDTKLKALAAHASQLPDQQATLKRIRQWSAAAGKAAGVKYAEAFLRLDLPP
ncbi:MAG: PIG-L deacetylase family protein [Candidatus Saccharimonadales bacterium]